MNVAALGEIIIQSVVELVLVSFSFWQKFSFFFSIPDVIVEVLCQSVADRLSVMEEMIAFGRIYRYPFTSDCSIRLTPSNQWDLATEILGLNSNSGKFN